MVARPRRLFCTIGTGASRESWGFFGSVNIFASCRVGVGVGVGVGIGVGGSSGVGYVIEMVGEAIGEALAGRGGGVGACTKKS